MARISKGKQERMTKETLRSVIATPTQKAVMERAMNYRYERFQDFVKTDPVFAGLNVMQQCAVLSFRGALVEEKNRLAQVDGYEKGMIDCIAAVLNVLAYDYWPKASKKRFKKFVDDVSSLMDSKLLGNVTFEEMADDIERISGHNMHCNWMGVDKRPSPKMLFKAWR